MRQIFGGAWLEGEQSLGMLGEDRLASAATCTSPGWRRVGWAIRQHLRISAGRRM
jgi:hypothetical protein